MKLPLIKFESFVLRPWNSGDAEKLVLHANNPRVAVNLRDGFPHPYTRKDAEKWLGMVVNNREDIILAIEVEGDPVGGIGIHAQKDVYRFNGEIGYWLSEIYWGRGIMTMAVGAMTDYAFTETRLLRLFASVFESNPASMRVLEKCGYRKESVLRQSVVKEGERLDEHYYAILKEDWQAQV